MRLLVSRNKGSERILEVAHEALFRSWGRLATWLGESREFLLWHQRLRVNLEDWKRTNCDQNSLLRGLVLEEAENWLSQQCDDLSAIESDYIQTSRKHEVQEAQRWKELYAEAKRQRNVALSGELAMLAVPLIDETLDRALLLSVEATNIKPTFRAQSVLYKAISAYSHLHVFIRGHVTTIPPGVRPNRSKALAFHPMVKMIGAIGGYNSNLVKIWEWLDSQSNSETLEGLHNTAIGVAFNRDGKFLAGADSIGNIVIWEIASRQIMYSLQTKVDLSGFAYHPNGSMVATVSSDHHVQLWDIDAEQVIGELQKSCSHEPRDLAFSPNGQTLAVAAGEKIILWNIEDNEITEIKVTSAMNLGFHHISYNPNGKTFASHANKAIYLFDTSDGHQIDEPLLSTLVRMNAMAFSSDGSLLASNIHDALGAGIVVHALGTSESKNLRFVYPSSAYDALAFSPDNRYLAVYHADDAITLWDIAEPYSLGEELGTVGEELGTNEEWNQYIFHTSEGRLLAVGISEQGVSVMEPGNGTIFSTTVMSMPSFSPLEGYSTLAVSNSGHWLAAAADNRLYLFDLRSCSEQAVSAEFGEVLTVAFNQNDSILAIGNKQGHIVLYELTSGIIQRVLKYHSAGISTLKFSRDGIKLASADVDNQVILWDIAIGQLATPPLSGAPPNVTVFSFSGTGSLLAAGGTEGFAIWNVSDGSLINSFGTGSFMGVPTIVSLAPEGDLLAVSYYGEKGIELWDGKGTEQLGPPLSHDEDAPFAMDFSPDGKSLIAIQSGRLVRWDMDLESWRTRACKIASRNLTSDEWQRYFGDRPYHSTCGT